MKRAFLFPGQGSQTVNLLNDLPPSPVIDSILSEASCALGENVYKFHSKEALTSTKAVQISLLAAGVAAFKLFESKGIKPDIVAGHSVGAFSAAVAAGVIEFTDALKLVELRGRLMENVHPKGYGMGVILGMEENKLAAIVNSCFQDEHPVFVANRNAPDQATVSGAISGIQKVLERAMDNGARCASLLNVSTPSHCPLLLPVAQKLHQAIESIPLRRSVIPYAGNRRARLLFDPVEIRKDLAESISAPVQWHDATTVLYEKGVRIFIEMPPGNVLSRLASKAFPEAKVLSVTDHGVDDCCYIAGGKL